MSPQGRPKGECRSAQHEGQPSTPQGRPKGECRSAQHEGQPSTPQGRPKGECQSAQHAARPLRAKGRHTDDPRSTRDRPPTPRPKPPTEGAEAERLGAAFLEARGLSIVERNYRRRCGELDLVARDGATLVFVEVRLRRGQWFGGAAASITAAKRKRLIHAASLYLAALNETPCCRFDALLLDGLDPARIEWLQDVIST